MTGAAETDRLRAALADAMDHTAERPDIPFPARYAGVYADRRRECGWQLYDAVGVTRGDRAGSQAQMLENFRFFGAPHVAVITTEADLGAYGVLDCGAFVTGFALAAEALDIATIPQAAPAAYAPFLRRFFGLPDTRQVLCVISLGLADKDHPANGFRTTRAPLAEVLSRRD